MRSGRHGLVALAVALSTLATSWGCSSRSETASVGPDSTLAYPAKQPDGIAATITFCRDVGKKSGKRLGAGQAFTMRPDAKVLAFVDLENLLALGERNLEVHLVWSGPGGKAFYTKRLELSPSHPEATLKSSISIEPGKRESGPYALRVYLFRELIAEKSFRLRTVAEAALERSAARAARRAARSADADDDGGAPDDE